MKSFIDEMAVHECKPPEKTFDMTGWRREKSISVLQSLARAAECTRGQSEAQAFIWSAFVNAMKLVCEGHQLPQEAFSVSIAEKLFDGGRLETRNWLHQWGVRPKPIAEEVEGQA